MAKNKKYNFLKLQQNCRLLMKLHFEKSWFQYFWAFRFWQGEPKNDFLSQRAKTLDIAVKAVVSRALLVFAKSLSSTEKYRKTLKSTLNCRLITDHFYHKKLICIIMQGSISKSWLFYIPNIYDSFPLYYILLVSRSFWIINR